MPQPSEHSLILQIARALEIAHVLFMDIVSYSLLPMDLQPEAIFELQELVRAIPEFQRALAEDQLICLPTGDGMALAFFPKRSLRSRAIARVKLPG